MFGDQLAARLGLPLLTRRAKALVVGGLILVLASVLAPPPLPGTPPVADAMLFTGSVMIGFVAAYSSMYGVKKSGFERLRVYRRMPRVIVEGRETIIEVVVENRTPLGFELVEIVDNPPPLWRWRGVHGLVNVPPRGRAVLAYRVTPVLGRHRFGPIRLVYRDPLGLVQVSREAAGAQEVRVHPRPLGHSKAGFRIVVAQQPAGLARTRRRGMGSEFFELREYQPGDETRYIDWKATARTGRLMVKVMEKEVVNRIVVVADLSRTMYSGITGETKAEYAARIMASLAEYFARRGDNYKLAVITPDSELLQTPWLRGRASADLARRFLADSIVWSLRLARYQDEAVDHYVGARVRALQGGLVRHLPRGKTLIIFISDFGEKASTASSYVEIFRSIRRMRHEIVVIMPVTIAFEAKQLGPLAPLYRLLSLNKIQEYYRIRRLFHMAGVPTVVAGPLDILNILLARIEAMAG